MKHIGVIIGSTRPNRVGPTITKWLLQSITPRHNISFEIIDLKAWNLPLLDEPEMPAKGIYANEKTKQWSEEIKSKDGFIFVTPQYNLGYPASLKNAVDYLFKEWNEKPAIIASYAYRGGGKAADQFRQVTSGLKLKTVETMPAINLSVEMFNEEGRIKDDVDGFDQYSEVINKAVTEMEEEFNKLEEKPVNPL
ncbi:hypothetical protein INT47_007699 [Mucor saturninus]|uniref:NADPH-dependent FMN reductase-like domain-containing protein n=1 Tax=Mucor saturninus TaxID=64648 RepID=A0A8H7QWD7_9FUNG|nr:hypothetical protein INT47_007699 [Mucor saturninus]